MIRIPGLCVTWLTGAACTRTPVQCSTAGRKMKGGAGGWMETESRVSVPAGCAVWRKTALHSKNTRQFIIYYKSRKPILHTAGDTAVHFALKDCTRIQVVTVPGSGWWGLPLCWCSQSNKGYTALVIMPGVGWGSWFWVWSWSWVRPELWSWLW